jgi:hypothetical protein
VDETQRVIRIVFLDFRKAIDLNIDHNKLLENMCNIGVQWRKSWWGDRPRPPPPPPPPPPPHPTFTENDEFSEILT